MDIYWKTPLGDELRIADADTEHPRLQQTDRVEGWIDCHPRVYPLSLFALAVSLLSVLDDLDLIDDPAVAGCGIQTEP